MGGAAALLKGEAGCAWVIAPLSGRLLATTTAGGAALGLVRKESDAAPVPLDRAMPALARLARLAADGADGERAETLVLWGRGGAVSLPCRVRLLTGLSEQDGEPVVLVRADDAAGKHGAPDAEAMRLGIAAAAPVLAELAHELRTPLGAVVSLAEVLREEQLGPLGSARYREYAADIHRSASHALAVINAMLDRDSLKDGRPVLEFRQTDLNELAAECIAVARAHIPASEPAIALDAAERLPHVILDRRGVRQMLLNLLANAMQHGAVAGKVRVTTGAGVPAGAVSITVEDGGPGMRQEEIGRVMAGKRAAAQGSASTSSGSGIGLPLVRALAIANGARLDLSPSGEGGLRATITFAPDRVVPV